MACRNEIQKLTALDEWYKLYTKKAGHRQHKTDKKEYTKKYRKINKKMCEKDLTDDEE